MTNSPFAQDGLSSPQAARLLAEDGPNSLPANEPKSLARITLGVLREPMFLMLLAAGVIYLLLGDPAEAAFLMVAVFAVIGLALVNERKTQRALEALRDLSAPRALVRRDGREQRIPSRDVVRGDLLVVHEGDRVAADALLIEGHVTCDESLLTGESIPSGKEPASPGSAQEGEALSMLYASTLVTGGAGLAQVCATGTGTEVGRIGSALQSTAELRSPLQEAAARIVRYFALLGGTLACVLFLLAWQWDGRPPLESLLLGIAFAMSILPEEIPLVLTVFLALGAWRLSRRQVLTRRIEAVEALGGVTVLAVDKTGTLTFNRMAVDELRTARGEVFRGSRVLPEPFHELVEFAQLATPAQPFDPMEKAIRLFAQHHLASTEHDHPGWQVEQLYPLDPGLLAMTQVFPRGDGQHVVAAKGAPEAVADLCHLDAAQLGEMREAVAGMASRGLRVLGVARGTWQGTALPAIQHDFDYTYLGLVALQDPPRPDVRAAIETCIGAGVRILMMTGDHPVTAQAIAQQVGLPNARVLAGGQIDALDDVALAVRLRETDICARLAPRQKLRLVQALQAMGERVAMTGDGVNDAPALRAANVGIAMGERGTDVAREAAGLVLLDDSFASITGAIRQGRHIGAKLAAAIRFIVGVHVPVVALALVPLLFHWPVLLLPAQVVLLELLIDPACSILFDAEPETEGAMSRPPADASLSVFSAAALASGAVQGSVLAAVLLAATALGVHWGWPADTLRATVFLALIAGIFVLAFSQRGRGARAANPWFARMGLASVCALAILFSVPVLREAAGFGAVGGIHAALAAGVAAAVWAMLAVLRTVTYPASRAA